MKHSGGCLCGEVRFEVEGKPSFVGVGHCKDCQLRTGSLFGVGVFFAEKKIGVLMGGLSPEREVSLTSGNAVLEAVKRKGLNGVGIDVDNNIASTLIKL